MAQLNFQAAYIPCDKRSADVSPSYVDAELLPFALRRGFLMFHSLEVGSFSSVDAFTGCGLSETFDVVTAPDDTAFDMRADTTGTYMAREESGLVNTYKMGDNESSFTLFHTEDSGELTGLIRSSGLFGDATQMVATTNGNSSNRVLIAFSGTPIDEGTNQQYFHGFDSDTADSFLYEVITWDPGTLYLPYRMTTDFSGNLTLASITADGIVISQWSDAFQVDWQTTLLMAHADPTFSRPLDLCQSPNGLYVVVDPLSSFDGKMFLATGQDAHEEVDLYFGGESWSDVSNPSDDTWVGEPKQLEYSSATNSVYLLTDAQIEGVYYPFVVYRARLGASEDAVPPLRQRQRDDKFRTPRMRGAVANHPTSRQFSLRQGNRNSYW